MSCCLQAATKVSSDDIDDLLPKLPEDVTVPVKEDVTSDHTTSSPLGEVKCVETANTKNAVTTATAAEISPPVLSVSPKLEAAIVEVSLQEETVLSEQPNSEVTTRDAETELDLIAPVVTGDVLEDEVIETAQEQVVVAKLEVSESVEVVASPIVATELPPVIAYPRLDSLIAGECMYTVLLNEYFKFVVHTLNSLLQNLLFSDFHQCMQQQLLINYRDQRF